MNYLIIIIIILLLVLVYIWRKQRKSKEGFDNRMQYAVKIYQDTYNDFQDKNITYDKFLEKVPIANSVLYDDFKKLYKKQQFYPENIEKLL
jgi:hypothetical protein